MRGRDDYDTTCAVDKITAERRKKIFVINGMLEKADLSIKTAFEKLLNKLGSAYEITHVDSSIMEMAIAPYYIIAMAEASTNLAKYTGYKG